MAAIAMMLAAMASRASGMGFYGTFEQTLGLDIKGSDTAVIARLIALPKEVEPNGNDPNLYPMGKFDVQEILKGAAATKGTKAIEAPFFDDKPVGGEYLVLGTLSLDALPKIVWSAPYALSDRSRKYVSEIVKLPPSGAKRLVYFLDYLEDKEFLLAHDSYSEFDLAPIAALRDIKARMPHVRLAGWIKDPAVVASHRRLYLKMLGVCGGPGDLPMLETLLQSDDPKFKMCLDATVVCYLMLKHADGLPRIANLFLKKDPKEPTAFSDMFSVIMALRRLDQQGAGAIPRDRLVAAMRLVLDHPQLADQAIMDLARWQDWSVMDRVVSLFKSSDPETNTWVRAPAINYLRACPLPKAKQYIEELRKIDPKAVQQSEKLYSIEPKPAPGIKP